MAVSLPLRLRSREDAVIAGASALGSLAIVVGTVSLTSGRFGLTGSTVLGGACFIALVSWCLTERKTERTLAALALYLGLLDGYVKLRTGNQNLTLVRDVLVVAIAAGALFRAHRLPKRLTLPPLSAFVIGFAVIVLIQVVNPNGKPLLGALAGVRQHVEFVPLFFLAFAFVRTPAQLRSLLFILVLCAAAGGVVSYIQSTLTPEEFANWGPGYRDRVLGEGIFLGQGRATSNAAGLAATRPFGLGSDAGSGAVAAALALPAFVALAVGARGRSRFLALPLAAGLGLAAATSGSRSALVLIFASLVAFGLLTATSAEGLRAVVGVTIGVVLLTVTFQQLGARDNSATERTQSIVTSGAVSTYSAERADSLVKFGAFVSAYPLGVGVGHGGPAASIAPSSQIFVPPLDFETGWNFLLLELGLPGLLLFISFHIAIFILAFTRIRRIPERETRLALAAIAAPIFGLFLLNFSGPPTVSVPGAPFLWAGVGILSYWLLVRPRTVVAQTVEVGR
jgi:hypothetical protein